VFALVAVPFGVMTVAVLPVTLDAGLKPLTAGAA
jgi:hypothetical protein